jgi:hypothetical protein
MLYLLAGRRDEALKPIPSLAPPMQDSGRRSSTDWRRFWTTR